MNLRRLEELAARDPPAKRGLVDEVVLAALLLLAARLARCVRHRDHQVRIDLQQRADEARFAGPARGGDDVEVAGVFHGSDTLLDVLDLLAESGLQAAWILTLPDFDE